MRSKEVRIEKTSVIRKWNKGLKMQVPKSQIIQKKVVSEIPKIQDQKNIKASTYTLPTIRTVLISNNVL